MATIKEIRRQEATILRHFVCKKCNVMLNIITGDREASLAVCPRCHMEFDISISIKPLQPEEV